MRGPVRRIGPDLDRELQGLAGRLELNVAAAGERLARFQRTLWTRGWSHDDILAALSVMDVLATVPAEQITVIPGLLEPWGRARHLHRQAQARVADYRRRGVILALNPISTLGPLVTTASPKDSS
jgi:hypothetical protein